MSTPLNTTLTQEPFCVRQLALANGTLDIFSRQSVSGICPGSISDRGNYRCCGMHDTCLGYGLCHRTNVDLSTGRSNFYMAGCNDANYNDDVACPKICVTQQKPDVMWDSSLGVWRCCGVDKSGRTACDEAVADMSGITFLAPAPNVLVGEGSQATVDGLRLGVATVTSTSVGAAATGGSVSHHSGGLSSYAIAGIAVGVIVPVVLTGVVGVFLMQRKRANKRRDVIEMTSMEHWHR